MHHIKWLWNNMGEKRPLFVLGLFVAALSSAMLVINPMLSQRLIDDVVTPGDTGLLPGILLTMFGVQMLRLCLRYLMIICMEVNSTQTMTDVRRRMYEVVQSQDYRFLNKMRTGQLDDPDDQRPGPASAYPGLGWLSVCGCHCNLCLGFYLPVVYQLAACPRPFYGYPDNSLHWPPFCGSASAPGSSCCGRN